MPVFEFIPKLRAVNYISLNRSKLFGHFTEPMSVDDLIRRVAVGSLLCYSFDQGAGFIVLQPHEVPGSVTIEAVYSSSSGALRRNFALIQFMSAQVGATKLICHAGTLGMRRLLKRMGFVYEAEYDTFEYTLEAH